MRFLLALILGAVFPLGFAPFGWWPLALLSLVALFWLVNRAERSVAWVLWWFAAGKYAVGASWIYVSINVFGGAPPPLAAFLVVLFVIALAFFYWPAGYVYGRWRRPDRGSVTNVLFLAALLIGTEWLLTWLLTGFPWLFVGHAMLGTPLGGLLPVTGTLGAGLLAALSAGLVYLTVVHRSWRLGIAAVLPWVAAVVLGGVSWTTERGTHAVALVQGNLDQARKWLPEERVPNVRRHLELTQPHWDAQLIVWPEAAITMLAGTAADVLEHIDERGKKSNTNVVLGIPAVERFPDGTYEFKNAALALGVGSGRFAKHHLVPFGEFVPLEGFLRGLIQFFDLPMSSTTSGARDQPNLRLALGGDVVEAAMAICYEVAYGESLRRQARTAGVLLTISNDTWFGASIGPLQHMQIAQVRAAENGRWLLRATNNGVTAIVNARGQIVEELPQFTAGALRGEFALTEGRTPYNRLGDWPTLIVLALLLGAGVLRGRRPGG